MKQKKYRIIACNHGHGFEIGTVVHVVEGKLLKEVIEDGVFTTNEPGMPCVVDDHDDLFHVWRVVLAEETEPVSEDD